MHRTPTSACSSASSTGSGAFLTGLGAKSSSNKPLAVAPRSSIACSRLAATLRLVSSAINATCSPGRTFRHTSTAFLAPAISSLAAIPKDMLLFYLNSAESKFRAAQGSPACNRPRAALGCHTKRRDLPAAAAHIRQARCTQTGQEAGHFSAEQVGCEIHEHVLESYLAAGPNCGELAPVDGYALLHDPATVGFGQFSTGQSLLQGVIPIFGFHFPS